MEDAAAYLPAKIALIGALGIGSQWLAWRMNWPAIVLMSVAGLIVGPFWAMAAGEPLIDPEADFGAMLRPAIAIAVGIILFEGGLNLNFTELRGAGHAVRRLVILGAPVGWGLGAVAAHYVAGLPWDIALLFGGLMVVTGPTVIIPLLRQAKLSGRGGAVLRWEGIVNDPIGALLAVLVYEVIRFLAEGRTWFDAATWIAFGAVLGAVLGIAAGYGLAWAFRKGHVPEFLKAPVVLAAVLAVFVLADMVAHETGLLAVTVFGVTVANSRIASIEEMRRFKESIAVILVSGVFVILSATLTPEVILSMDWRVLGFVLAMMFLVRPVTVLISTLGTKLTWAERGLVAWIAPRGIVAVTVAGLFAAELTALGRPEGEELVPLTFAMVFATVIAHGFTIKPLAQRLNLASAGPEGVLLAGANPWSLGLAKTIHELGAPVVIADSNWRRLRAARLEGLPVYFGEVLSEHADHRLDHSKIGHVVAATPNDAYNALVCVEFAPEFGRHRVWQLSALDKEEKDPKAISFTARGRTLIRQGRSFDAVSQDWWRGWRFRATSLTEEYGLEQLREDRPDADFILERRPDGTLQFLGANQPPKGGAGAVIVTYGPPREGDADAAEKKAVAAEKKEAGAERKQAARATAKQDKDKPAG